jgi:hypothetical protein
MKTQATSEQNKPFLYAGVLMLAVAVFAALLADNPQASATTVVALDIGVLLLLGAGVLSLLMDPVWRVLRTRL